MNIWIFSSYFLPEVSAVSGLLKDLIETLIVNKDVEKITVITNFSKWPIKKLVKYFKFPVVKIESHNKLKIIRVLSLPVLKKHPAIVKGMRHLWDIFSSSIGAIIALFFGKPDVIFLISPPLFTVLPALSFSKVFRIPMVLNVQDLFPQYLIDLGLLKNPILIKIFKALEKFAYKKADVIFVHSEGNKDFIIKNYFIESDKIKVIYNWIDTEEYTPNENKGFLTELGLDKSKFIVFFGGTIGYSQAAETIINAARLIEKNDPEILFLIVGDGPAKPIVMKMAEEYGLKNIKFVQTQPMNKFPYVIACADVCLVTLRKTVKTPVVPSKLLGIMASGKPAIVSVPESSDAKKIIENCDCGIWVEAENAEKLAESILDLKKSPEYRKKLGRNGRNYVMKHFDRRIQTQRILNIFKRLLKEVQNGTKIRKRISR